VKWYNYLDRAGNKKSFPHKLTQKAMTQFGYSESTVQERSVRVGRKNQLEVRQLQGKEWFTKKRLLRSFTHTVQDLFHTPKERKATPGYVFGRVVGEIEVIGDKNPKTIESGKKPEFSQFRFGRTDTREFKSIRNYSDAKILDIMSNLKKGKLEGVGIHNLLVKEARRRKIIV